MADSYSKKLLKINNKVAKALKTAGYKKDYWLVDYSAYRSDDADEPLDNLNEIAIKGKCVLQAEASDFYGGPKSKDYTSIVMENPTWLQLCILANEMIIVTNDYHHVFLEGVELNKELTKKRGDAVRVYDFIMGS